MSKNIATKHERREQEGNLTVSSLWLFQAKSSVLLSCFRPPVSPLVLFNAEKDKSGLFDSLFQKSLFFDGQKAVFTQPTQPEKTVIKTGLYSFPQI